MKSLFTLPCLVGTQLYKNKTEFHLAGVAVAAGAQIFLCLAHLYTAGRKLGLISTDWKDMDMAIAAQKSIDPLVTKAGVRNDASACLRHFLLAMGVPAEKFAKGKLPELPSPKEAFYKGKRPVNTLKVVHSMAKGHKAESKLGVCRREVIEQVLISLMVKENEVQASGKSSKKQHSPTAHFTPQQLLSIFKKAFIANEPMLNFDFISFWRDCFMTELCSRQFVMLGMKHLAKEDVESPIQSLYHLLPSQSDMPAALLKSRNRPKSLFESTCKVLESLLNQE